MKPKTLMDTNLYVALSLKKAPSPLRFFICYDTRVDVEMLMHIFVI